MKNLHQFLHRFLFWGKEPSPVLFRSKEPFSVYFAVYYQKSNSFPTVPFLEYFSGSFPVFHLFGLFFLTFSKNLKSVPRTLSRSTLQSFLGVRTLPRSISRSVSGVRTLPRSFSRSISVSPNIDPTIPLSGCTVKVYR